MGDDHFIKPDNDEPFPGSPDDMMQRLETANTNLEKLAAAVLLFHRGGPWTAEDRQMWIALTGEAEATTKALCDFARRAMGEEAA